MSAINLLKGNNFFKNDLLFIIVFSGFAYFYYDSVLDKMPLNAHLWRQTDCLSLSRNYAHGANFFSPEMDTQLADDKTSGKTAGEFPVLYYMVGKMWSFFGESYISYRLFWLLLLFAGLFSFYKSLALLFKDNFWAIAISALLFTSPVYAVYGVSFLTDAPAFSFVLIGLYFFIKYSIKNTPGYFYLSMAFLALGGLLKVSSLIAFVFLFAIFLLEAILNVKSLGNQKVYKCSKHEWIGFIAAFLSVFLWYYYASWYNGLHGFKYTFNDIYPMWVMKDEEVDLLIKGIKNFTINVFFSKAILFSLLFIFIANLFLVKKIPLFAYLANIIITLGAIIYFILWAPLMGIHDYYYIALLILFLGIFLPFVWFVKSNYPLAFNEIKLKIFFCFFLLFNFLYCLSVVQLKTLAQKGNFIFVGNHAYVELAKWTNWDVENNWYRFEAMKPYLKQIGIRDEDKIISLPDDSFNTSLYLSGHKGWTNFVPISKAEDIDYLIHKGAKYLFLSNPEELKKEFLNPFLTEQIGDYNGVLIFKLSENRLIIKPAN